MYTFIQLVNALMLKHGNKSVTIEIKLGNIL